MAARPRTPSIEEPDDATSGLGINGHTFDSPTPTIHTHYDYDIHTGLTDSPERAPDSGRTAESASSMLSPTSTPFSAVGGLSPPASMYSPATPQTASTTDGTFQSLGAGADEAAKNPFNFTTQQYVAGQGGAGKGDALGRRKGHKYRHSSIHASAMDSIIQPPAPRTPLAVPSSLPMPTRTEAWWSMTPSQTTRLAWCLCHFLVAAYVQFSGSGSLSMTALSLWTRPTLRHPFGLERADVLAGFGLAVFIAFMGLDIISHGIQHSLENLGHHESHSPHSHARVSAGHVDFASVLAILSTLISAILLKNHRRIGRAMRFELIASWGRILGNPSHLLTLLCSCVILILPFLTANHYRTFDLLLSICIASLMILLGARLGTSLASMLLMSFRPPSKDRLAVRDVIQEIEGDAGVGKVEEARFWQVHYGLCMANVKLRYRRGAEMAKIRQRIVSIVRRRLGDVKGVVWEVTVQMSLERD
ncbi:Cation efflux family [Teratosphaeria destructans]|uniref:Zinc transporter n=1 Tax=Teratosphaeria destructans TaxID=418781 RepID=A0A9W7W492_9PEZI|nr:Cation efflux family [Teratosphaeria destructans]